VTNRGTHALPRKRNGVDDLLKHTPPHMCYHAEFGRSAFTCVCKNTGEAKSWGALEINCLGIRGVVRPQYRTPSHVLVGMHK